MPDVYNVRMSPLKTPIPRPRRQRVVQVPQIAQIEVPQAPARNDIIEVAEEIEVDEEAGQIPAENHEAPQDAAIIAIAQDQIDVDNFAQDPLNFEAFNEDMAGVQEDNNELPAQIQMTDAEGNEELVSISEYCSRTIAHAVHNCITVLEHGTSVDRVNFVIQMKEGINRVYALQLTPINEVIEEAQLLQQNNPLLPRLNPATASINTFEPSVQTTDAHGIPEETRFSIAVNNGVDFADSMVVIPQEAAVEQTSE